jgi:hypothetical protein
MAACADWETDPAVTLHRIGAISRADGIWLSLFQKLIHVLEIDPDRRLDGAGLIF